MKAKQLYIPALLMISFAGIQSPLTGKPAFNSHKAEQATPDTLVLPAPFATPSVDNSSKAIGWPEGKTPIAPEGFTVSKFADGLDNPRWLYVHWPIPSVMDLQKQPA
jgi:glucose/arabinose dehydrogenase